MNHLHNFLSSTQRCLNIKKRDNELAGDNVIKAILLKIH